MRLFFKARGLLLACLIVPSFLLGSPYIFNPDSQLVHKTELFAQILAQEVKEKTGISLYLIALESLQGRDFATYKEELLKDFTAPYGAILFIKQEKKIDIITQEIDWLDKKDIYWNYIVPLIPKKESEITPPNISAMLLNGFVQLADTIALHEGVALEHSFVAEDKGTRVLTRTILYGMLFALLILFLFRWRRG